MRYKTTLTSKPTEEDKITKIVPRSRIKQASFVDGKVVLLTVEPELTTAEKASIETAIGRALESD